MSRKLIVLVADDELLERKAIVELIHLCYEPVEVIEVDNGLRAVEAARQFEIDIAFMDIAMPVLNGLDALREMYLIRPELFAVMLTAYDAFEYAIQALKLGVDDYVLKPARKKKIHSCIQEYLKRTDEVRCLPPNASESKSINVLFPYLEDNLLLSMAMGNLEDTQQLLKYFFPDAKHYALAIGEDDGVEELKETENVKEKMLSAGYRTVIGNIGKKKIAICACTSDGNLPVHMEQLRSLLPKQLQISPWVEDCKGLNVQYRLLTGCLGAMEGGAGNMRAADGFEKQLATQIASDDEESAMQTLMLSIRSIEHLDFSAQRKKMLSLSIIVDHYLEKMVANNHFGELPDFSLIRTPDALYHAMRFFVKSRIAACHQEQTPKIRKLVRDIVDDIESHYSDGLYSLNAAAQNLDMSPGYLSKLFKTRMGVTFTEYLSEIRIDEAKRLLKNTEMEISDISIRCGFNSANYFCKIFKKIVGIPASDYRDKKS